MRCDDDHAAVTIVSHGFELANRAGTRRQRRACPPLRGAVRDARRAPRRAGRPAHFADRPALPLGRDDEPLGPKPAPHAAAPGRAALVEPGRGTRGVNAMRESRPAARSALRDRRAHAGGDPAHAGARAARASTMRVEGRLPMLPPLRARRRTAITSRRCPRTGCEAMAFASGGMMRFVRQRYTRYFADLSIGLRRLVRTACRRTRARG